MPRSSPRPSTGNTSIVGVCLTASVLLVAGAPGAWGAPLPPPPPPPTEASPGAPAPAADSDPAPAAMTPQARDYFDRGLKLYSLHEYAAAIEQFQRGFAVEPRREFLFAQAQAWRLSGKCDRAIPLYQRFIESTPAPLQREAARLGLDRCAPDRLRGPAPTVTGPRTPPNAAPLAPPSVPASRAPWWRDAWGDVAVASGVAALGVSWAFAIASNHARDQAESLATPTEQEFDRLWTSAQRRREIAIGTLVGGAVLVAVGALRLALVREHEREAATARAPTATARAGEPAAAALTVWSEGVGLTWRSCF